MAENPTEHLQDDNYSKNSSINECIELLSKAFDALADRCNLEEAFSGDLTGGIKPTIQSLRSAKATYIKVCQEQAKSFNKQARIAVDEQVKAAGIIDLLNAAIAVGKVPLPEELPSRKIEFKNNVKRIPWLEIIKEIIDVVLTFLEEFISIPGWLLKVIRELLKIIDKLFGGMPHEDLAAH